MRIDSEVAVIVCAGPSLDALPSRAWGDIAGAGAIAGVNGACAAEACLRNGVPFTVLAAMDLSMGLFDRVPRLAAIWNDTPAWRVTSIESAQSLAESYLVEVDEADGVDGWSDHPGQGYKGGSTGMIIGNWIANDWPGQPASPNGKTIPPRGFRKLAYVGLDMQPLDGRHAAGAGAHASGFSDTLDHHRRVSESWGKFCAQAAARGVEVVNLTPATGLATMRRVAVPEWSRVA